MRCNRKFKLFAVFAVLASGLGLMGCRGGHSPEARVTHITDRIANKLDFNQNQKSIMDDMTKEIIADMASEKQYKLGLKDEIQKMIESPELDPKRLKELFNERHQRMEAKVDKYITKISTLHKTLTPEQKSEIIEKMNKLASHLE